jgi:phosphoribosylamine--glycine ligase
MKVLVIGGGGREHALVWALGRSPRVHTLRCAPGNAGTAALAENVAIPAGDVDSLVDHAATERYDLVVVGPEAPLVAGLADRLMDLNIPVFGPSAAASRMEGSKVFSKEFMARHRIPTAAFRVFRDETEAREYLLAADTVYPLVVKADGLAAGKGVILADTPEVAVQAATGMLTGRDFGDAGRAVVVEEMLQGIEASFFVLADGINVVELATCQDYKRALDGDRGLNTGGMGTYSPSAFLDDATRRTILDSIVTPTIRGLQSERCPYRGVLFIGVMLTEDGPKVLEYNCRFGDPETQVLLPRLDGDWFDLLLASATGRLDHVSVSWLDQAAVCVVMAAGGYPGSYGKGERITGLDEADKQDGIMVFHAGTRLGPDGTVCTSGGRVLGVTALGNDLPEARTKAYTAAAVITWDGEQHRTDIAADAAATVEGVRE